MKFVPNRDFDLVASSLNFSTPDLHVLGGCDLYTTKAVGADKKLYKNIDIGLEEQYKSNLRFSKSLSPPQIDMMADSLNLSRSSPFGNLGMVSSRRTYAYLIATLNASHPDYDFSHMLRPRDFKCEKSLRSIMNNLDTTLYNLRARPVNSYIAIPSLNPTATYPPNIQNSWGPGMWRLIDQQMSLRDCAIYCYAPDDFDPFEDDEAGALWSMNYFFFNKARKRVCYIYLRGVSVLADSGLETPLRTPVRKRAIDEDSEGWLTPDAGASKRARFWLGDETLGTEDEHELIAETKTANHGNDDMFSPLLRPVVDDNDQYLLSDEETRSARSQSKSTVRGMSEEIIGSMEV